MRDPRHPRHFTDEFKRQIVDLHSAGKPKREAMDEYDLDKSTVERWIKSINATGSPRRPARRAGPRRAGRGRGPRRQRGPVRPAQDKGVAREVGRHRQPAPGLPHHGGERPGRRMRREEVQGAPRGGRRGRRAQRRRARLRRQGAAHPYMQRPDLRARRGLVELRPPARRPLQQGDRRPLRRAREGARPVKSAFATLSFPIPGIEVFHTDRGSEFDNAGIDPMLEAFGIERSPSAKGRPYDNAVDESTNRILKAELVHREAFGTTRELRAKLSDNVHRYDNFRIHSTPGHMSPVEFREAGLSLPESSK